MRKCRIGTAKFFTLLLLLYRTSVKFQVLYLFHGGTGDDSDYVNFSNIVRYAEDHKIAVVMPCGYNSGYENGSQSTMPWQPQYWNYVFEELPKVCASMFPISTKREDTFIAGLSMGSMAATKWAVYGCDRCCAAVAMSGGGMDMDRVMATVNQFNNGNTDFEVDMDVISASGMKLIDTDNDLYHTAMKNVQEGKEIPKFIMTCGGNDFIRVFAHASRDALIDCGYKVEYIEEPGYTHEWDFWDLSLRRALNEWLPIRHDVILPD